MTSTSRTNRIRRTVGIVVCLALLAPLAACGEPDTDEKKLRRFVRATDKLAFRFTYSVNNAGPVTFDGDEPRLGRATSTEVRGLIEDDFRYKAGVLVQEKPTFERVVGDDAIAVRFLDTSAIGRYVDRAVATTAKTDTDIPGVTVADALKSGRWVLDPEGAPSQTAAASVDRTKDLDPVTDALGVFDYVLQAINDSAGVGKWSKDSLDPAYRTSEDPFPKPDEGSGVVRYDLRRPKLPPPAAGGQGSDSQPGAKHFRKMAVYVKDGRVIQVREAIEITGRGVQDFIDYNITFLRNAKLPDDEIDDFKKFVEDIPEKQRGALLLGLYTVNVGRFGGDPITPRTMSFDLADLGEENRVDLPATDVVKGSLAVLVGIGRKPAAVAEGGEGAAVTQPADGSQPADGAGPTEGDGDSTTTTAPGGSGTSTSAAP